jgi:hypothetical protein
MKSYSDDLPNVTKEEVQRATDAANEAVNVSKATLAVAEDLARNSEQRYIETTELLTKNRKLLTVNLFLGIINLAVSAGIMIILAQPLLG